MIEIAPVILASEKLLLRPLALSDCGELDRVAHDGRLWEIETTTVPTSNNTEAYIRQALLHQEIQQELPFAIVTVGGTVVGTTRYRAIDLLNDRLEIGSTWIAASYHRTYVNTHAKYLLLQHAFEKIGCIAVEFRADATNIKSRNALERLGAKQDGVLRSHRRMNNGRIRDTAVYSIIADEWSGVKLILERQLERIS